MTLTLTACSSETTQVVEILAEAAIEEALDYAEKNLAQAEDPQEEVSAETVSPDSAEPSIDEAGCYTSAEDVALYIHTYGHLPSNFITKKEAQSLGWSGGGLEPYAPGMCIGGNRFGNYEGLLPEKDGRTYTECDIDTLGAESRGAKRIVFSNDGLIYYTEDHYASFTLLYGEE
ncbi:MAG: ribonuclease [Oscillospiraceae bacterium]|nr:ribonuclease [Oscillospiraceae bacterium]